MICKKCNNTDIIKAGFLHGNQRYKCKNCSVHFVGHRKGLSEKERLRAVRFCTFGISMNLVAQMFCITTTTIARWVKRHKQTLNQIKLSHEDYDRTFAKVLIAPNSKYFRRQLVCKFQLMDVQEQLKNYSNVKCKKNHLGN
jgi:transposase-like protein